MKDGDDKNDFELIVEMPEEMVKYLNNLAGQPEGQEGQEGTDDLSEIVVAILDFFKNNNHLNSSGVSSEQELLEKILKSSPMKEPT